MTDSQDLSSRLLMNPNKPGTDKYIDRDKVAQVIYEASKGSAYFENERRKDQVTQQRISHMVQQLESFQMLELASEKSIVANKMDELERERDLSQWIVHVDMDAFYAAVEELEKPELCGKPMAVGDTHMLCTSNYEARKYGVRSALPGFIAKKLCPHLILIPPNFEKYTRYSLEIQSVFKQFDPDYLQMSLDEAYLNITHYLLDHPPLTPGQVVQELRLQVFNLTGLTCSAGIAPNKYLAKICSDVNKPNGQKLIENNRDAILSFLESLDIRRVPGIGRVMEKMLKGIGIETCGQLKDKLVFVYKLFSSNSFEFLIHAALGIGECCLKSNDKRKSMSVERTFTVLDDREAMLQKLEELSHLLACDLEEANLKGKNVGLKLKKDNFEVITRSKSIVHPISTQQEIFQIAKKILMNECQSDKSLKIRLMGLRLSQLVFPMSQESGPLVKFFKKQETQEAVECPICFVMVSSGLQEHVEACLERSNHPQEPLLKKKKSDHRPLESYFMKPNSHQPKCPVCGMLLDDDAVKINQHLDDCIS